MAIEEILSIGIVGTAVSFFIQFIKNKFGAGSDMVKVITLVSALIAGGLYYFLSDTEFFVAFLGVLGSASVIWSYFLKGSTLFVPKKK
jgi:membrane associated rhomboid family serine protease